MNEYFRKLRRFHFIYLVFQHQEFSQANQSSTQQRPDGFKFFRKRSVFVDSLYKERNRTNKGALNLQIVTHSNDLNSRSVLFITRELKNSSYCEIMVRYIITLENGTEMTKFSRELNTYGAGEELLHPVQMNDSSIGQPQPETNLATYLINFKEFQKSNVEVRKNGNKAWYFLNPK